MNDVPVNEQVLAFECGDARLWGIVARPGGGPARDTAVLIAIGGPQYRVGSHRQFVRLARALARAGYTTMRFDYTGMGDSGGDLRTFEQVGPDLGAALDVLTQAEPAARRIVVWGLCDAASAALMHVADDVRIAGIVAANPWARSAATLAVAHVKHYYAARLLQREFWGKLLGGGIDWRASWRSLAANLAGARAHYGRQDGLATAASFQTRMAHGLRRLRGPMLLILSGNDLAAKEFLEYAAGAPEWRGLLEDPKLTRVDLAEADHTFSSRAWEQAVERETIAWLNRLDVPSTTIRGKT